MEVTVKEFKEWLNRFPDDTVVQFGVQEAGRNYESYGPLTFENPELNESCNGTGWEYIDFRGSQFVKEGHKFFNKTVLRIGEAN